MDPDERLHVQDKLYEALEMLRAAKGDKRSEYARRLAITITELEKVYAYYFMYVVTAPEGE